MFQHNKPDRIRPKEKRTLNGHPFICRLIIGSFLVAGCSFFLTAPTVPALATGPTDDTGMKKEHGMSALPLFPDQAPSAVAKGTTMQPGLFPTLPKQGDSITIKYQAPLFTAPVSTASDVGALQAMYFGQAGDKMTIKSLTGEMVSFQTYDKGTLWIPLWYASEASAKTENLAPQYVTLRPRAKLSLAPTSSVQWTQTGTVVETSQMVAMAKWNDWYGVIVTPSVWHKGYEVYRPTLLWVRDQDVTHVTPVPTPLLGEDSQASLDKIRGITDLSLKLGDDKNIVLNLLGAPSYKETSEDLQTVAGDPLILGEAWRYERQDAHFIVSFSQTGKLVRTHWIIPGEGEPLNRVYAGDNYMFSQDYSVSPLPRTLDIKSEWRNQGTLGFTYLIGTGEDTLLIKGDDGGFSGMHYASSLYAVGRSDGKTRWQLDAGFGILEAVPESSGDYAYVYTSYNPAEQKYVNQVRRIRMSDGTTMWERKSGDEYQMGMWAAQKSVILMTWKDTGQDNVSASSVLSVLDSKTGKERWQKSVARKVRILNQGSSDPYVLIRDKNKLEALDLMTGKPVWQIKAEGNEMSDPSFEPFYAGGPQIDPFAGPDPDQRWILVGDTWRLLELQTGTSHGEYKATPGERFEVLNERYLLVQYPLDNSEYWSATQFETRLYDVAEKKTKFTISGKGTKGTLHDGTLYLAVNGIPAAIDMNTGSYVWRMSNTAAEKVDLSSYAAGSFAVLDHSLLFPYGSDILLLDKQNGSVRGRLRDIRTGYAELREQDHRNGTLIRHGDELYVGTANGGFIRYDLDAISAVVR